MADRQDLITKTKCDLGKRPCTVHEKKPVHGARKGKSIVHDARPTSVHDAR